MQLPNRILFGTTKDKEFSFIRPTKSKFLKKKSNRISFGNRNDKEFLKRKSNRILFGTKKGKEFSSTRPSKSKFSKRKPKRSKLYYKRLRFKLKNRKRSGFFDYQKRQYKKFFVSRKNYVESIHASGAFKFAKTSHIFFLVFCTYFFGLRFISSYDWFYWRYLINALYSSNLTNIKKYFQYKSLFTSISFQTNMIQLSLFLFIFKNCKMFQERISFFLLKNYLFNFICIVIFQFCDLSWSIRFIFWFQKFVSFRSIFWLV